MRFENIMKTTVYLTDMADFNEINLMYGRLFKTDFPARSFVKVSALSKGALFEINVIAVK